MFLITLSYYGSGFGVWGSGFRVQGSGFRVQGLGFGVKGVGEQWQERDGVSDGRRGGGLGFRALAPRVYGVRLKVWGRGFRAWSFGQGV